MLNHDVKRFSFTARESLKLDMKKRNFTFVGPQERNFFGYELLILRFSSLGSVRNDAWKCLKRFTNDKTYVKDILKWCSSSSIIGSNYIWRHRVKKLLV